MKNHEAEELHSELCGEVKDHADTLKNWQKDIEENQRLREENKRLREALDILEQSLQTAKSFKAWDSEAQEDYCFSESLAFQQGKEAYQNARAKLALTKPT
jgi:regulator of replication initiation timing